MPRKKTKQTLEKKLGGIIKKRDDKSKADILKTRQDLRKELAASFEQQFGIKPEFIHGVSVFFTDDDEQTWRITQKIKGGFQPSTGYYEAQHWAWVYQTRWESCKRDSVDIEIELKNVDDLYNLIFGDLIQKTGKAEVTRRWTEENLEEIIEPDEPLSKWARFWKWVRS